MKTFKEVAKDFGVVFNENKYAVLSESELKEIAKAYASQAIDKCADIAIGDDNAYNSILKVKELLK